MAAVLGPQLMTMAGLPSSSTTFKSAAIGQTSQWPVSPSGIHVLLVDDEKLSRTVVGNLLRKCNYKVTVVDSGEDALQKLQQMSSNTFHLVLTDLMMPVVDGLDVLKFVRSNEQLKHLPVVMMSAMEHSVKMLDCLTLGAEQYIVKPVTQKEVQSFWQHVCRRLCQSKAEVPQHPSEPPPPAIAPLEQVSTQPGDAAPLDPPLPAFPASANLQPPKHAVTSRTGRSTKPKKVLLSQWLTKPNRTVDPKEAMRIFCELLILLEKFSAEDTIPSLRPSRLHLYTDGRIMFADPASIAAAQSDDDILYLSPEETAGEKSIHPCSCVFSLGMLFFELYNPCPGHERTRILGQLRRGVLPPDFLKAHPQESSFILSLLHQDPASRPTAAELAASDMFRNVCHVLRQRHTALEAQDQLLDAQVLYDFLSSMKQSKSAEVGSVSQELDALTADIDLVKTNLRRLAAPTTGKKRPSQHPPQFSSSPDSNTTSASPTSSSALGSMNSSKRQRGLDGRAAGMAGGLEQESAEVGHIVAARWSRVLNVFEKVQSTYFVRRAEGQQMMQSEPHLPPPQPQPQQLLSGPQQLPGTTTGAAGTSSMPPPPPPTASSIPTLTNQAKLPSGAEGVDPPAKTGVASAIMFPPSSIQPAPSIPRLSTRTQTPIDLPAYLSSFSEDLGRYSQYSRLETLASMRYGDLLNSSNMVCSMSFDRDDEFFATAGVNKRIKIFEYSSVIDSTAGIHYPLLEINSRSKLSSVCWSSYIKNHLACSDYDGIVQLWDTNTNTELMQFEEHEKRVWCVDFSRVDPTRLLSGSDDCTVKLWAINQECSVATIPTKANICSVQFSPESSHLVAVGSANFSAHLYDLRSTKEPLATLTGHKKAVSYVKFMTGEQLVTASTDSTLRLWDVARASDAAHACSMVMEGHTNERNFVGLSVLPDGYVACGSETNNVYCYYRALPMPVTSHAFGATDPITGVEIDVQDGSQFVSSVCWSAKHGTLLAANSSGYIKLLALA